MRLPFPERIPIAPVFCFAVILCMFQLYQGTAPLFSLGCFAFIFIAAIAFNIAGGLTRPSGAYILAYSVLAVIVGLFWKVVLGEPGDSNLSNPMLTIGVYVCSIGGMLMAAIISRRLATRKAVLAGFATDHTLQSATIGCLVIGFTLSALLRFSAHGAGSVLSAVNQLNRFLPLALFLGVIHAIRSSGGTRSISIPVLLAGGFTFLSGVLAFSKEGMLTPFVCWLIAASSQRYKLSQAQVAGGALSVLFIFFYLVPYSQYGRNSQPVSFSDNVDISIAFVSNLGEVRRNFKEAEQFANEGLTQGYFNVHQGFFDRLQMIGPDDSLIEFTEQGHAEGITPVYFYFSNLVPHFIWADKPTWGGGNLYAHEMGYLAEDDLSTGISFSPSGEAYHLLRWTGILLLLPILWTILFFTFDSLCGDTRKSPWGLLVILVFAHIAPEGGIGALIYALGYLTFGMILTALTVTYLTPIIGEMLIGPPRANIRSFQPPRRSPVI